jgi:DNA-directed RNA polymerase subunit RPC12/RpoP
MLTCEYCGSSYPVAEIEALYAEEDKKAEEAQAQAEEKEQKEKEQAQQAAQTAETEGWDTSGLTDDWGEDADGMKVYNCPSCGAELICDATTAATSCPYCDNPTIVPGQFGGVLKPDYVIPFKINKEQAIAALKKHYVGKRLLPNEFQNQNHLEEIKGIYVPFWLFDGEAEGRMRFEATKTTTYRSGEYRITKTMYYDVHREGVVSFARIPVDGSTKMPDDYMDSIEPFNYEELKPFSTAYLPGYMADKYDVTVEESGKRADTRAENTAADCIRNTVTGYVGVMESSRNIHLKRGEVKYALLPVWILNTKWNGKTYMFAMNGQTGKFVGDLPVDQGKKKKIFAAVYGISVLVVGVIVLFAGGLLNLLTM